MNRSGPWRDQGDGDAPIQSHAEIGQSGRPGHYEAMETAVREFEKLMAPLNARIAELETRLETCEPAAD